MNDTPVLFMQCSFAKYVQRALQTFYNTEPNIFFCISMISFSPYGEKIILSIALSDIFNRNN